MNKINGLKDKSILFIAPHYSAFIKNQIEAAASSFDRVYVICPENIFKKGWGGITGLSNVSLFFPRFFHLPVPFFRKRLGKNMARTALKVLKKKNIKVDLLHAHFTWAYGEAGRIIAAFLKVPFIVTAHGGDIYELPFINTEWRNKICLVLEAADRIITVSAKNRKFLEKLGYKEKSVIITNGFNQKLFFPLEKKSARRLTGIEEDAPVLVTVGNLLQVKNHSTLIEAVSLVKKVKPGIKCFIIGSGPLEGALRKQIKTLNLENSVFLTGPKSHDRIHTWINSADLFVLPSINEGNPTVMFEALGCGVPFIGTKAGGIGEIITSDNLGLLYENPTDAAVLSSLLITGLNKEWDHKSIAWYGKKFTMQALNPALLKIYKELLNI